LARQEPNAAQNAESAIDLCGVHPATLSITAFISKAGYAQPPSPEVTEQARNDLDQAHRAYTTFCDILRDGGQRQETAATLHFGALKCGQ
jgi:hypothetical protein